MTEELDINPAAEGDDVVLAVGGEIDITTAAKLTDAIAAAGTSSGGDVILDMAEVSFMDSSGIAALVKAFRRLEPDGRRLIVRNAREAVHRTLEVTALAEMFGLPPALPNTVGPGDQGQLSV